MTPDIGNLLLKSFDTALAIALGMSAWWRKDGPNEDAVIVEAANTVLDALGDADIVGRIDLATGRNLRDQMSIEDAIATHDDREQRSFARRN